MGETAHLTRLGRPAGPPVMSVGRNDIRYGTVSSARTSVLTPSAS